MDTAVQWLRNTDVNPEEVDEATLQALANVAGIPLRKGRIPRKDKAKVLDNAVN
jgi:hypothetical protein